MAKRLTGGSLLSSSLSVVSVAAEGASTLAVSSFFAQPANAAVTATDRIRTCGFFTTFMGKRLRTGQRVPQVGATADISQLHPPREVSKVRDGRDFAASGRFPVWIAGLRGGVVLPARSRRLKQGEGSARTFPRG